MIKLQTKTDNINDKPQPWRLIKGYSFKLELFDYFYARIHYFDPVDIYYDSIKCNSTPIG